MGCGASTQGPPLAHLEAATAASLGTAPNSEAHWYYSTSDKQQHGPCTLAELQAVVASSASLAYGVPRLAWRPGWSQWIPPSLIPELSRSNGASSAAAGPESSTTLRGPTCPFCTRYSKPTMHRWSSVRRSLRRETSSGTISCESTAREWRCLHPTCLPPAVWRKGTVATHPSRGHTSQPPQRATNPQIQARNRGRCARWGSTLRRVSSPACSPFFRKASGDGETHRETSGFLQKRVKP